VTYSRNRFGNMKAIYAELSEAGHFGSIGMWASMTPTDESGGFEWTSYPRWRDERTALIACAQALELCNATQHLLREFADEHLRRQGPARVLGTDHGTYLCVCVVAYRNVRWQVYLGLHLTLWQPTTG
jgi:hypothetical protein